MGCILPSAVNITQFWDNIINEKKCFSSMASNRFSDEIFYGEDIINNEQTYSKLAAQIPNETIQKIADIYKLNPNLSSAMEIMSVASIDQALTNVNYTNDSKKISIILGIMQADHFYSLNQMKIFKNEIDDSILKNNSNSASELIKILDQQFSQINFNRMSDKLATLTVEPNKTLRTEILNNLKSRFEISGESFFVDAACASSLCAIDLAIQKLISRESDLVLSGGLEDNLKPEDFITFSKVKALAKNQCLPFDKASEGLIQGEGSVIFALQRLEDAIKYKNKIFAVITGIGAASDGNSASLFQPTIDGQIQSYQKAYSHLENNRVDYLEAHGTGTLIGDQTELISLSTFFKDLKVPLGSVKALIGHTKGAAGSAGLLKSLLIIQNRKIPSSSYLKNLSINAGSDLYINKEIIKIKKREQPIRIGISSFGFGGINYHLVIDEYIKNYQYDSIIKTEPSSLVVINENYLINTNENISQSLLKIPPLSQSKIDNIQLIAISLVYDLLKKSKINLKLFNKDNFIVISSSVLGLDKSIELSKRVICAGIIKSIEQSNPNNDLQNQIKIILEKIKNQTPEITEDSAHGTLSNVIAGRVCNFFDFKGKSFNIDSELLSYPCAINIGKRELEINPLQIVIIIGVDEKIGRNCKMERIGLNGVLLTSEKFAQINSLPIKYLIDGIQNA